MAETQPGSRPNETQKPTDRKPGDEQKPASDTSRTGQTGQNPGQSGSQNR